MLKIALCDDEKNCREIIKDWLKNEEKEIIEIFEYQAGFEILRETIAFDLIFMDVEMPGPNGIETATKIREKDLETKFIFISAYPEYAVETFPIDTFWFMKKPVTQEEFLNVFLKFLEKKKKEQYKISFKLGTGQLCLEIASILYIESEFGYVNIHTETKIYENVGETLKNLEIKLSPYDFIKNDRGFLTNMAKIKSFTKDTLILNNDEKIKISARRKKEVAMSYGAYLRKVSL